MKGSKLRKGSTINLRTKRTGMSGRLVETKGTVLFNTRRVEGDDIAEDILSCNHFRAGRPIPYPSLRPAITH